MGGTPTKTRKLTVDNEAPTSILIVSDEVIQRLKAAKVVTSSSNRNSEEAKLSGVDGDIQLVAPPSPYLFPGPTITALQIRQEKEEEIRKNEQYWEKRIADLEKNHDKMHNIMKTEYQKALQELKSGTVDVDKRCLPPCFVNKKAVTDCYKKYPNEPMRCAAEVRAFTECVDMKCAHFIANKG